MKASAKCLVLCGAAFLVAGGLATGAALETKSRIAAAAKGALESMAPSGMEAETGRISVSLCDRTVEADGWTLREKGQKKGAGLKAKRVTAVLSSDAAWAFLPLPGTVDKAAGKNTLPVFDSVEFKDVKSFGSEDLSISLEISLGTLRADHVRMHGALFKELMEGRNPGTVGIMLGTSMESLAADALRLEAVPRGGKAANFCAVKKMEAAGIAGVSFREGSIQEAACTVDDREVGGFDKALMEGFRIEDGIVRKLASLAEKNADLDSLLGLVADIRRNGHVFKKASLSGFSATPEADKGGITLSKAEADWASLDPFSATSRVQGLKISLDLLEGFKLPGLDAIEIDATAEDSGTLGPLFPMGVTRWKESSVMHAKGLFKVDGELEFHGMGEADTASMNLEDDGGMARLALMLESDGIAALKQSASELCANDAEGDRKSCAELIRFIERPGKISATLAKRGISAEQAGQAVASGRLGSVLNISTAPGPQTIEEQVAKLSQQ